MTSSLLRPIALMAAVIGAAGSLFFMLRVGSRAPFLLLVLFIGWVLAPFAALVFAARARASFYWVMLLVSVGSLVIYGSVALGPPRPKPAAAFLLVPLASWVIMGVMFGASRRTRP